MVKKKKLWTLISLIIIIPVGFYCKFYHGPAFSWVNNSLGGVFYVIFWCLIFFLIFSQLKSWIIAVLVFIITCLMEFLQLWHPPFLEYLRNSFLGRTILGNSFNWNDFAYYFVGAIIGWLWISILNKKRSKSSWNPDQ